MTTTEHTEFLSGGLRPHTCATCGTRVLVKKHTSIQWTTDAARSCPVFAEQVAAGESAALLDTCEKLIVSIAESVQEGKFGVLDA